MQILLLEKLAPLYAAEVTGLWLCTRSYSGRAFLGQWHRQIVCYLCTRPRMSFRTPFCIPYISSSSTSSEDNYISEHAIGCPSMWRHFRWSVVNLPIIFRNFVIQCRQNPHQHFLVTLWIRSESLDNIRAKNVSEVNGNHRPSGQKLGSSFHRIRQSMILQSGTPQTVATFCYPGRDWHLRHLWCANRRERTKES